jgi:hypothetical protein
MQLTDFARKVPDDVWARFDSTLPARMDDLTVSTQD